MNAPLQRPAHVPQELVREYPFRRGRFSDRKAHDIISEVHATLPEAFYVMDLYPGKSGWVFRRAEDVRTLLFDGERFSPIHTTPFAQLSGGGWLPIPVESEGAQHLFYRALLNPLFTPKKMAALEDEIRSMAQEYIGAFKDKGRCEFVQDFALEFPIKVFLKLMGLPLSYAQQFLAWEKLLISGGTLDDMKAGIVPVIDYLRKEIEDRKLNPREDIITYAATAELRGRKLDAGELLGFCFNMYVGGLDTVSSHMAHMFRHLADNPEQQALLRAHPERISDAVEEMMRGYASVTISRICVKETELRGVKLMPGDRVAVSVALAGRDPIEYENADTIDFDRKSKYASFGQGAHLCIGIHLAKRELRIAIEEMLNLVPTFRVAPDAKIKYDIGNVVQMTELPLVWDV
jgi:cytochrome P450